MKQTNESIKLKYLFRVVNGSTPRSTVPEYWDGNIPWATPDDFGNKTLAEVSSTRRSITEAGYKSCGTQLVPKGSIVLTTRAPIGSVAIARTSLCTNQGCRSLVPLTPEIDTRFYYYYLYSRHSDLQMLGSGTTFTELGRDELKSLLVPHFRRERQHAISRFLDGRCSHIQKLIAAKQRQIQLLEEKRSAIITQAVTKGLDPNVKMKDSGVEWIGEIPEHWEVRFLGRTLRLHRGFDLTEEKWREGEYPVITSGGVAGYHAEPMVKGPGLVIGRTGAIGTVFFVEEDFWPHNTSLYVVENYGNDVRFGYYLLQNVAPGEHTPRSAVPGVNRNDLHGARMPVPPISEQQEISNYLSETENQHIQVRRRVEASIELLKEYRTSLINAAVTGQIDVSDYEEQDTA